MSLKPFSLTFILFSSFGAIAQENPYDLLNELDPAAAPSYDRRMEDRQPASVDSGQITVRESLPDAKLQKTARTLQWEMLKNPSAASPGEEEEAE